MLDMDAGASAIIRESYLEIVSPHGVRVPCYILSAP